MAARGDPVHFELQDADCSGAGVAITIHDAGSVAVRTLGATEILHITDLCLMTEAGGACGLFADTDVAGRRVVAGTFDILSGIARTFKVPYACPVGITPIVIAAAGNIDLCGQGFITQN